VARLRIAALLSAAALAAAGCGGDDEPETTTTSSTTTTEAGATGATGATGAVAAGADAEPSGPPIEDLVAAAARVEPDEVSCGEEALEEAIGGGGTCSAAGTQYVVADRGEKLELDSLTAKLSDLRTTDRVSGDFKPAQRAKEGTFVVATLAVTNTSDRKAVFDDFGEQVELEAAGETYKEPFDVLNGVATDSFLWESKDIKPGETQLGEVVFDVPDDTAEDLEDSASILVLNFEDQGNRQRADQAGLLRTAE
jgi:hypothetical protein